MDSDALPDRKYLPHGTPGWVRPGAEFFVTGCCVKRGENRLCRPEVSKGIFESIGHYHRNHRWFVYLFVLMPDHWHAILAFPDNSLRRPVADWKRYLARSLKIEWQRDFFDHRLRNDAEYEEKAAYIRNNPVRKGLVARAENWPHAWDWRDFGDDVAGRARSPSTPE